MFENIRIILIETSHPGNIGSAARAMKTMGLQELYLINPHEFPSDVAKALAVGADDILEKAVVLPSLNQALEGCELVIGTSARNRSLPWPMLNPEECAVKIAQCKNIKTAVLFGREYAGLTNEELQLCHYHLQIPANPEFSSLNLAAAVQIVSYEIRKALLHDKQTSTDEKINFATSDAMELYYQHLEKILLQVEFLKPTVPNRIMPRLRRLFSRAHPETEELHILRGILAEIEKKLK